MYTRNGSDMVFSEMLLSHSFGFSVTGFEHCFLFQTLMEGMYNLMKRKPKRYKIFKEHHYLDDNAFATSVANREKKSKGVCSTR